MSTTTETAVRERGINLYPHEVRGILDGRQTQLRRVAKFSDIAGDVPNLVVEPWPSEWIAWWTTSNAADTLEFTRQQYQQGDGVRCPFGAPGDVLWGREPFVIDHRSDRNETWVLSADRRRILGPRCPLHGKTDFPDGQYPAEKMQKWASVLWLEIESVRVERVQDIDADDARAEGIPTTTAEVTFIKCFRDAAERGAERIKRYAELWDRINGAGSWASNPWVWCLTFKRV